MKNEIMRAADAMSEAIISYLANSCDDPHLDLETEMERARGWYEEEKAKCTISAGKAATLCRELKQGPSPQKRKAKN